MSSVANHIALERSNHPEPAIAEIPLFGVLPQPVRDRLGRVSRVERFAPGTALFRSGDVPRHLHVVLSGIIDLFTCYRANEFSALMLAAGDVFMPAATLHSEPYLTSARTLTASRLLLIDADAIRREARDCTELALALARVMAGQWRVALKIILNLKCRSPSQRLAAFLLRLEEALEPGASAQIPFSKRQLASRIGMQPETLSRTLQTLAANGLYLRGREIIVTNRAAAEEFCGPDPYPLASEQELGVHAL